MLKKQQNNGQNFEIISKISVADNYIGKTRILNTYKNFKMKKMSLLPRIESDRYNYVQVYFDKFQYIEGKLYQFVVNYLC